MNQESTPTRYLQEQKRTVVNQLAILCWAAFEPLLPFYIWVVIFFFFFCEPLAFSFFFQYLLSLLVCQDTLFGRALPTQGVTCSLTLRRSSVGLSVLGACPLTSFVHLLICGTGWNCTCVCVGQGMWSPLGEVQGEWKLRIGEEMQVWKGVELVFTRKKVRCRTFLHTTLLFSKTKLSSRLVRTSSLDMLQTKHARTCHHHNCLRRAHQRKWFPSFFFDWNGKTSKMRRDLFFVAPASGCAPTSGVSLENARPGPRSKRLPAFWPNQFVGWEMQRGVLILAPKLP